MLLLIALLLISFLTASPHQVAAAGDVFLTGDKTLEITDYSIVKEDIATGSCIRSEPFTVGQYQWLIEFYPWASKQENSDYVSVFARLINTTDTVRAIYTHRLQDWTTSTWSTNTPATSQINTFQGNNNTAAWGYRTFYKRSDLDSSNYLRNDKLLFKTTLWVVNSTSTVLLPLPSSKETVTSSTV